MKKIVVASKNPVKIKAALIGFQEMFTDEFEIVGLSVPSDVADQPMTSAETLQGAMNRTHNAQAASDADFWVGIEGGVEELDSDLSCFAWVVVHDGKTYGKGKTGTFFLPPEVSRLVIEEGLELGDADDRVFGKTNSKQNNGAVGLLTNDAIMRATLYVPAVIFALMPFKNPKLYS